MPKTKSLPIPNGLTPFKKKPIGICIHHSATPDGKFLDSEGFRKYHIETNGWKTIGYHKIAERVDGEIVIVNGRPEDKIGAHCPDLNSTHLGLCVCGNFDETVPDNDLLDVAVEEVKRLAKVYGWSGDFIKFHCDYPPYKTCPGKKFPKEAFCAAVKGEPKP